LGDLERRIRQLGAKEIIETTDIRKAVE